MFGDLSLNCCNEIRFRLSVQWPVVPFFIMLLACRGVKPRFHQSNKNYKNRLRITKVMVENRVERFFLAHAVD